MRTIGVEEELLLVGLDDARPAAVGDQVVSAAADLADAGAVAADEQIEHEFKQEQAETATKPCDTLDQVRSELVALRSSVAQAARLRQAAVVAIATSPIEVLPHPTDDDRYAQMNAEFGLLARQQLTCGQHVHVEVESRDEGVAVLDRIRVWLPALLAISANSPYWQGVDSGYASYRTVRLNLWPSAGPTELFGTVREYDRQIEQLIASGAAIDDGMVYFSARLSARFPTVEIRVADICTDVDDAVLVAALSRALVDTAATNAGAGEPPPAVSGSMLRAATWRAARFGLTGQLFDPVSGGQVEAWRLVDQLVDHVAVALATTGDTELVAYGLDRLRRRGTGSEQQRRVAAATGSLHSVIRDAAERTQRS